tara:strand:- start:45 stop:335 length:291 start_codon:yes stop_codon:yes gene_type:complete
MKSFLLWIHESWELIMNAKVNPLRYIPDPSLQAYFTIVLFTMWSCFFGLLCSYWGGLFANYDTFTSIVIHLLVVVPIIITNSVFKEAEKYRIKDGT